MSDEVVGFNQIVFAVSWQNVGVRRSWRMVVATLKVTWADVEIDTSICTL